MKKIVAAMMLILGMLHAEEIYATFTVEAKQHADLAFITTGIVSQVNVDIASVVKKGTVLAVLENSDANASLQMAQTALKFAKRDYERQSKVKKLVDEAQFDRYAYKYEHAKAEVVYKKALYEKTLLKAPFDGVIYAKMLEVGDAVSGAMIRTVLKIQSTSERKLVLDIDQKYWKVLKAGLTFRYRVDGDETLHTGTITKVYPYANSDNRKIHAEVEVSGLTPGLFGSGYIVLPEKK